MLLEDESVTSNSDLTVNLDNGLQRLNIVVNTLHIPVIPQSLLLNWIYHLMLRHAYASSSKFLRPRQCAGYRLKAVNAVQELGHEGNAPLIDYLKQCEYNLVTLNPQ